MASPPSIKGFVPVSFSDWPGRISAVVFLPGCNFRCPYCHNRRLWESPQSLETLELAPILEEIRRQRGWIDGITITGGEPTVHEDLSELIHALRCAELGIKLDTNGAEPERVGDLLDRCLLEAVSLDVKAPLRTEPYRRVTGVEPPLAAIRETLERVIRSPAWLEVRTTVVPGWHGEEDLLEIVRQTPGADRHTLQRYRPPHPVPPILEGVAPQDLAEFRRLQESMPKALSASPGGPSHRAQPGR